LRKRYLSEVVAPQPQEHGGEIALREKDFGSGASFTWNDYQSRVRDFALGLVELGLGRGDVVGIMRRQPADWVSAEIAAHAIAPMSLGLYRDVLVRKRPISSAMARPDWYSPRTKSRSTSC